MRQFDAGGLQVARVGRIADQCAHLMSVGRQRACQMSACKAGRSGYEDLHRSATSVTGEPTIFSSPTRSRTPSDHSVRRRDPMAL